MRSHPNWAMIKNPGCLECIGNYTSQLSTNQYNVKLEDFLVAQLINLEFDPSCRHRSIQRVGKYNQKIQALRITFVAFHKFLFNKFYLPACFTFVAFHMFLFINLQALGTWQILCTATAPTNGGGVRDAMRKPLLVKAEAGPLDMMVVWGDNQLQFNS